jgi:hypothetical protein
MGKIDENVIAMNPYAATTGGVSGVVISKRENFEGNKEVIVRHRNKKRYSKSPNEIGYFAEQNRLNRFKTVSQALNKIKSGLTGFSIKTGKGFTLQRAIQLNNTDLFLNETPSGKINPVTQENLPSEFEVVWNQLILARQTSDFNAISSIASASNVNNGNGTGTLNFDVVPANSKDCFINIVVVQPDDDIPVQQSIFDKKLSDGSVSFTYNQPDKGNSYFFVYLVSLDNKETSDSKRLTV